jgi:hypothetical protein
VPARQPKLDIRLLNDAGVAPPVWLGPRADFRARGVAEAPSEAALPGSARWSIGVPADALNGLSELFLDVKYQGDVARLYDHGKLLDDDFYNGQPWSIGLRRFLTAGKSWNLELDVLPLPKDAPIYIEVARPIHSAQNGQACSVESIRLTPEYQLVIDANGK